MPTFFRPPRPARRIGRYRWFPPGSPILTAAGTSAGIAAAAGVGVALITAVGTTAGSASVTGAGAGVISAAGSSAGAATVSGSASAFYVAVGTAAGSSDAEGVTELRQIVSTAMLQNPVNCVLAGMQVSFKTGRAQGRAMRHAFGE